MAQVIPTYQDKGSKFSQDVIIGGISVTLTLKWNARAGYWFVSISDGEYEIIGKKLVGNWPLLKQSRALFPNLSGDIIAFQTDTSAEGEITYDNLNNGWTLYYVTDEELESWEDANGIG